MDHGEAERQMLSERYLLNELTPELRDEFEEHFFACRQCATDLEAGAAFLDHSKSVLTLPVEAEKRKVLPSRSQTFWARFRPAIALPLLGLVILISYQSFLVVPRLRHAAALAEHPQLLPALSLINIASRGPNQAILVVRRGEPFLLLVDIPGENRFTSYVASLRDSAGSEVWSLTIPPAAVKDTVSIQVPGRESPGAYVLVVTGTNGAQGTEVGRYPFTLQFGP